MIAKFVSRSPSAAKLMVDPQRMRVFISETHQRQGSGAFWYDVVIVPMNEVVSGGG